jgi:hypothetical protein
LPFNAFDERRWRKPLLTIFIQYSKAMEAFVSYASNIYVAVYQVLDEVLNAHSVPPGARATIHSIIDDLKAACASRELVTRTEDISLQLHHLEWAAARGDGALALDARATLRSIAESWLNYCI